MIFKSKLNKLIISDNSYYPATFPMQNDSKNKKYCISIVPLSTGDIQAFALRQTDAGIYLDGETVINNQASENDLVFGLIY